MTRSGHLGNSAIALMELRDELRTKKNYCGSGQSALQESASSPAFHFLPRRACGRIEATSSWSDPFDNHQPAAESSANVRLVVLDIGGDSI